METLNRAAAEAMLAVEVNACTDITGFGLLGHLREMAAGSGVNVTIVSMPNPDRFLQQDEAYRESVLPSGIKARVAVEAGVSGCWSAFAGDFGRVVGVDRFGASAPGNELFEHYGLTVEHVSQAVRDSLAAGTP